MSFNRLSSIKTIEIEKWPHETTRSPRLTMRVGIGLSAAILFLCFAIKPVRSHAVNQPSCHIEHQNDKIAEPLSSVRQCRSCGQTFMHEQFPSKGRGRRESRCRNCHNTLRRSRSLKRTKDEGMIIEVFARQFDERQEGFNDLLDLVCSYILRKGVGS